MTTLTLPAEAFFRDFAEAVNKACAAFAELGRAFAEPFSDQAHDRARLLLLAHLSPEQRKTFEAKHYFIVQGKQHRWRLTNQAYGVHRLGRSGRCRGVYCAAPRDHMPMYDVMLAQKLVLETDETAFLAVANHAPNYRALYRDSP